MLNILVAYEKPSWQRSIQHILSTQRYVSASYMQVGLDDRRLARDRFEVVILQCGSNKARLRDALTSIRKRFPSARIVLILEKLGISDFSLGHSMGISAILDESAGPDQVLASLEAAARGDLYVAAPVLRRAVSHNGGCDAAGLLPPDDLSDRELEVLSLVARGLSNKAIAQTLYISEKTVKNHLYSIFRKIGVSDRTKAALYAIKSLSSHKYGPYAPVEVFYELDEHQ